MLRWLYPAGLLAVFLAPMLCGLPGNSVADRREGSGVEKARLVFGVYAHIRSTELYKKLVPFRRYLRESLRANGIPAQITVKIFSTYGGAIDALAQGRVDFARYGPVSYVLAKEKNPAVRLIAMESNGGSKRFEGAISVAADSPIGSVDDLRGKTMAFGNRRSTTGRYLAQAALVRAGVLAEDLAGYAYLGRHDKVAFAVAAGKYDAGATNENTFQKYAAQKGLRKILVYPSVTKPWIARDGLNEEVFQALRTALLELDDADVLGSIKRSGFLPAEDRDYDLIREAMALAKQFDPQSLTFGTYTSVKAADTYGMVQPVVQLLERQLASDGEALSIRTRVFRDYGEAVDALVSGEISFGRFGPASYVLAKKRNPGVQLVVREDTKGKEMEGVFVVSADSPITSLAQIKGKTFAFGNRYSTAGRYVAQEELLKVGIRGQDLEGYSYLGRYDRVAFAVSVGNYSAGVLRSPVFERYVEARNLKEIGRFPVPHKVWVARAALDTDLIAELRRAFLNISGDNALDRLGIDGFVPGHDRKYETVRRSIESASQFE